MIVYTIEELHERFKNNKIDIHEYYNELFEEAKIQQKRLNAFASITEEKAMKDIENIEFNDILSGIPYVLKDNCSTKGIKTTASSKMLENYIPVYDASIVEDLNAHGVSLIGKASMDELAMGGTNESAITGPVSNPWDSSRISGGSSGGSAALVGSGLVPFAIGTDTGDSIRKPAGYCGVVGFKPTWGRISRYGVIPYASSLDHVGTFTRTVKDAAIVTEALAGRDDRDMTSSSKEVEPYNDNLTTDISNLKIGVLRTVSDLLTHKDMIDNFENVVNLYKNTGATVEDISMSKELLHAILPTYSIIANAEATSNHACLDGINYGRRVEADSVDNIMIQSRTQGFNELVKKRFILGNFALATQNQEKVFKKAQKVRRLIVDEVNRLLEDYDIILAPNAGTIAPKIGESSKQKLSEDEIILENFLAFANFSGTPSLSMPTGFVDDMPIGINVTGRLFEEQTVLNVAYALESQLNYKNQYSREG